MKKLILSFAAAALLTFSTTTALADTAPVKSVIHVITVAWKAGTTPEQIKAALDGAHALSASYPGITHVWTKTLKAQERTNVIVMEFASEEALKSYADSPAQKSGTKSICRSARKAGPSTPPTDRRIPSDP